MSREREISFAGGRTVIDNLDKELFEPVPIFVDSLGNFILPDWQYVYKGTIRDFYPPLDHADAGGASQFQLYIENLGRLSPEALQIIIRSIGRRIEPSEFSSLFDFAFLTLHGPYGEDGNIQGLLEWYGIPYSGAGILPSAIGINKLLQRDLMQRAGFRRPRHHEISRESWQTAPNRNFVIKHALIQVGLPMVVKSPAQGSSIGVTVIHTSNEKEITDAINRSFFIREVEKADWQRMGDFERVAYVRSLTDIREGIGMPVMLFCKGSTYDGRAIYHPGKLLSALNANDWNGTMRIESTEGENSVLFESFIKGREFSCIVIQLENGQPIALPPTEIIKTGSVYDYRSKYLPGISRKVTPIDLPAEQINQIKEQCTKLFEDLHFNVYARIDGFINERGEVFLNDPNTTSGMLPSSFFFHQAAEIGLNPSTFLTYIIRTSLSERAKSGKHIHKTIGLLNTLDQSIADQKTRSGGKTRVGVIMGGYSSERHISVESGRNIYEKLAGSGKYEPFPIFLTGNEIRHDLYLIPVNVMLKDNADDIKEKLDGRARVHPALLQIREEASSVTEKYVHHPLERARKITYKELSTLVDSVFIALHGRPGEDGVVQEKLERYGIPYNGSGPESSRITINKYETNELLGSRGISVARHTSVFAKEWNADKAGCIASLEKEYTYPIIAKPLDDGCSSAVKKINNREELEAFAELIFRKVGRLEPAAAKLLNLRENEEFPFKDRFMVETLISREGASHFLEITGGLLTKYDKAGKRVYEVFEPSETLASGEVLSLEEKFLAGEGQNITPARFAADKNAQKKISEQVRATLKTVAEILDVEGYARIDAFVRIFPDNRAETIIIEVNSLPGMTPATVIFHQAAIAGYRPDKFIDAILDYGLKRSRQGTKQVSAEDMQD